jgi:uncharacterized protein (TIRG00374 family)
LKINKKIISQTLLILLAVGVFILIGLKIDWVATWKSVKNAHLGWFTAGILVMLISHFLRGWRWNLLLKPAGYPLNPLRAFYAVMIGYLINVATSRGGEFVRCAMAAKSEKAPVPTLVGSVVTERIIDLLVMALLAMLCLLLQFEQFWGFFDQYLLQPALNYMVPIIIGMACSVITLFWLKNRKKTSDNKIYYSQNSTHQTGQQSVAKETIFTKFSGGLQSVFQLERPVAFILASLGIWIGYWLNTYFMLKSLDVTVDFTLANALGVLIFSTLGVIVPLPGGAGVWGTLAYGLTLIYGLPQDQANTFGIYSVAVSNLLMIVFGSISYLLLYLEIQKANKNVAEG